MQHSDGRTSTTFVNLNARRVKKKNLLEIQLHLQKEMSLLRLGVSMMQKKMMIFYDNQDMSEPFVGFYLIFARFYFMF